MRTPDFWYISHPTWQSILLWPLTILYRIGVWIDRNRTAPTRVAVPVISIGNLTAGGSGKTPLVIALAEALGAKGHTVAVLTRGYGSTATSQRVHKDDTASNVGDEALELAHALPHTAVWAGRNRLASARNAIAEGATLLLLDDGFQHWALARTVDLVVVSASHGFGNGKLIPAGPLREPFSALKRADALVLMGTALRDTHLLPQSVNKPVFHPKMQAEATADLQQKTVVAFCGLGLPDKFFKRLESSGLRLAEALAFADHHPYTDEEITMLKELARKRQAVLVTTTKDSARLSPEQREGIIALRPAIEQASLNSLMQFIEEKITK